MWTNGPPESPKISGAITWWDSASSEVMTPTRFSCVGPMSPNPTP